MLHKVFSVYDVRAVAFASPFQFHQLGLALRSFEHACKREAADNLLYTNPEDYVLYDLGTFDDNSGLYKCHEKPIAVCSATDYVKKSV